MTSRGYSLVETMVALFLLLAALFTMTQLFHASLRYQAQIEKESQAILLAETIVDQIRAWAKQPGPSGLNFQGDWAAYQGVTLTHPDFPGFRVEVDARPDTELLSPCRTLEEQHGLQATRLKHSIVAVEVVVVWERRLSLLTYIGDPAREIESVSIRRVAGPSDPIPRDGVVDFEADALDSNGNLIPDLTYRWSLEPASTLGPPGGGLGTLLAGPANGASLRHQARREDGSLDYTPGWVTVRANASYAGREQTGNTSVLLGP